MQEKEDQKVVFVSLSINTNLEHEEHTQKKNSDQPTQDHWLNGISSKNRFSNSQEVPLKLNQFPIPPWKLGSNLTA